MAEVTEAEVIERLRRIQGPDGAGDLVSMGLIAGLVVKGGDQPYRAERIWLKLTSSLPWTAGFRVTRWGAGG